MSFYLVAVAVGSSRPRMLTGVALASGSAVLYNVGYILEKRALGELPALGRRPVSILKAGFGSRQWTVGFVVMLVALALQVLALTLAPVSVVQPILAGGLVGLAGLGGRVLQERLDRRQMIALGLVLAAVVAIAVSARSGERVAESVRFGAFLALGAPVGAAALISVGLAGRFRGGPRPLLLLSGGAGLLYGLGAVAEKAVATKLAAEGLLVGAIHSLATPYPWLFVVATAAGLLAFQVGLQQHPASMMATFTNVTSSVCALLGAAVVFGESILPGGWWSALRAVGFACVLSAVVLMATAAQTVGEGDNRDLTVAS